MWDWIKNFLNRLTSPDDESPADNHHDIERGTPPPILNRDIIIREETTRKRKRHQPDVIPDKTVADKKALAKKTKLEQQKIQREKSATHSNRVNEYTNLAQTYGGLFSLATAMSAVSKTAGSVNFGWVFFLGGIVKGFGSLVNIFRGDRSIAGPLGLIEAPIEMVLGAAMTAISSILLTMDSDDPAYMRLQITNGILAAMITGLLSVEQGYHRIRTMFETKNEASAPGIKTASLVTDKEAEKEKEQLRHRKMCAQSSHQVNDYINMAQSYAGLFSLSTAMSMGNPTAGSENYGWILFLGGLMKGFGSGVNIIRGDRSIAGPLGLIEAPIEMLLGAAMLATSSTLLTMNQDDPSYNALQITNGILSGMASGLLTLEQGYHKIRTANEETPAPAIYLK
ncbi:hypothetical protein [Legionella shakespearei]|uniref:Uncharacterized protein n=1 Tax=Legionella shakespearei DSM 23087 TaxID=1122169 RepID=A0A0W0YU01_9GAMM|nr:hypothetical protein [Legionella shakespearei]KTD60006.1 hypothetical protein Lsha_1756 [Legionella shakespearei DSM 23087]